MLRALASGVPAIVTNEGGPRFIVRSGEKLDLWPTTCGNSARVSCISRSGLRSGITWVRLPGRMRWLHHGTQFLSLFLADMSVQQERERPHFGKKVRPHTSE